MEMHEIQKLEQEHLKKKLECDLKRAKYESQQEALNHQINILCEQSKIITMACFFGAGEC